MDGFHVERILEHVQGLRSLKIDLLWEHAGNLMDDMISGPAEPSINDILAVPAPTIAAMHTFLQLASELEVIHLPVLDMLYVAKPAGTRDVPARRVRHGWFAYVRNRKAECNSLHYSELRRLVERLYIRNWLFISQEMIPDLPAALTLSIDYAVDE